MKENIVPPHIALVSGACAGLGVDISLYPLDTLKTRLQSQNGFKKSGGFSRLWGGIGPVIIGSAPTAAVFFLSYETGKSKIFPNFIENSVITHMASASIGEVAACLGMVSNNTSVLTIFGRKHFIQKFHHQKVDIFLLKISLASMLVHILNSIGNFEAIVLQTWRF